MFKFKLFILSVFCLGSVVSAEENSFLPAEPSVVNNTCTVDTEFGSTSCYGGSGSATCGTVKTGRICVPNTLDFSTKKTDPTDIICPIYLLITVPATNGAAVGKPANAPVPVYLAGGTVFVTLPGKVVTIDPNTNTMEVKICLDFTGITENNVAYPNFDPPEDSIQAKLDKAACSAVDKAITNLNNGKTVQIGGYNPNTVCSLNNNVTCPKEKQTCKLKVGSLKSKTDCKVTKNDCPYSGSCACRDVDLVCQCVN